MESEGNRSSGGGAPIFNLIQQNPGLLTEEQQKLMLHTPTAEIGSRNQEQLFQMYKQQQQEYERTVGVKSKERPNSEKRDNKEEKRQREQKRRLKISTYISELRTLLPQSEQSADHCTVLAKAIEYLKEQQMTIYHLRNELATAEERERRLSYRMLTENKKEDSRFPQIDGSLPPPATQSVSQTVQPQTQTPSLQQSPQLQSQQQIPSSPLLSHSNYAQFSPRLNLDNKLPLLDTVPVDYEKRNTDALPSPTPLLSYNQAFDKRTEQ